MTDGVHTGLHAAIGTLATFAAWAAFDTGHHQAACHLHTLALDAAVIAEDPDLRAHILADVAAHPSTITRDTPRRPTDPPAARRGRTHDPPRCGRSCTAYAPTPTPASARASTRPATPTRSGTPPALRSA